MTRSLILCLVIVFSGCAAYEKSLEEEVLEARIVTLEKKMDFVKRNLKQIDLQSSFINYNVKATACVLDEKICSLRPKASKKKCEEKAIKCLKAALHEKKTIDDYKEYIHGRQP